MLPVCRIGVSMGEVYVLKGLGFSQKSFEEVRGSDLAIDLHRVVDIECRLAQSQIS